MGQDTEITKLYKEQLIKHEEVKAGNKKGGHPDMEEKEDATFVHKLSKTLGTRQGGGVHSVIQIGQITMLK